MRHLVVCCDGTWQNVAEQTDAQQSNVSRLRDAILLPEPADSEDVGEPRSGSF